MRGAERHKIGLYERAPFCVVAGKVNREFSS
jgi:hypothetical protein